MDEPLAQIAAGTFDAGPGAMRLRLKQGISRKVLLNEQLDEKAKAEYARIDELVIKGKLAEALTATDAALKEYADTPGQGLRCLQGMKVYILARLPDKKETAIDLAVELAVATKLGKNQWHCLDLAKMVLAAVDTTKPESRDLRLVDLAIALLRENDLQTDRVAFNSVLGHAYHIRGDDAAAVRYTEQAATLLKAAKPMSGIEQESILAEFAERIAEYKKMVKPPSKEK